MAGRAFVEEDEAVAREGYRRALGREVELTVFPEMDEACYFWATHQGAELDLLVVRGGRRVGFEFKYSRSPGLAPSMKTALADLRLDKLWVVHPGSERYALAQRVEAVPLMGLAAALKRRTSRR